MAMIHKAFNVRSVVGRRATRDCEGARKERKVQAPCVLVVQQ